VLSRDFYTSLRVIIVLSMCIGAGVAYNRCKTTPEQDDLAHFVANSLPRLRMADREISEQLARLNDVKLKPSDARAIVTNDVMPRVVKLRHTLAEQPHATREVDELLKAYGGVADREAEACRTILRAIDDPKIAGVDGVKLVRGEFEAVERAHKAWDDQLARTLATHGLTKTTR